jgi:hypothetical protein
MAAQKKRSTTPIPGHGSTIKQHQSVHISTENTRKRTRTIKRSCRENQQPTHDCHQSIIIANNTWQATPRTNHKQQSIKTGCFIITRESGRSQKGQLKAAGTEAFTPLFSTILKTANTSTRGTTKHHQQRKGGTRGKNHNQNSRVLKNRNQ